MVLARIARRLEAMAESDRYHVWVLLLPEYTLVEVVVRFRLD